MWDSVWINARLATFDAAADGRDGGPAGIIEDGAIAVATGRIAWAGPMAELPVGYQRSQAVHDAGGRWITPGLIDCHTHLVHGGHRAREFALRLDGAGYEEIANAGGGILATVAATRAADEATLAAMAGARLARLMAEGVTTVEIKSGYGLETAAERKMLQAAGRLTGPGIRVRRTFLGAHAVPPEFVDRADAYVDLVVEEMIPAVAAARLADAVDAFGDRIAFTPSQVGRVFEAARAHGLPVKLHADQLSDQNGAALAAQHGALSADHLEYADPAGIEAMAAAGTVAVLLPGAFYTLRQQRRPPVETMRRSGVAMALATDCNPGSSPATSLLLMLNMGCTLFGLSPIEALAGVTVNAARALGLAGECGRLAPGLAADFALWDIDDPAELAYRIGWNPLHAVVSDGTVREEHVPGGGLPDEPW